MMYGKGQGRSTVRIARSAFGTNLDRQIPTDIAAGIKVQGLSKVGTVEKDGPNKGNVYRTLYFSQGGFSKHVVFFGKDSVAKLEGIESGDIVNVEVLPLGRNGFTGYDIEKADPATFDAAQPAQASGQTQ